MSQYVPDHTAPEDGEWDWSGVTGRGTLQQQGVPQWRQQHKRLVQDALYQWKGDPIEFQVHAANERADKPITGATQRQRARAGALIHELATAAKPNTRPLYRGSKKYEPSRVQSWTTRKSVADKFAKKNGGSVQTLPKGTARGIQISDYVTSGLDQTEKEWIVDGAAIGAKAAALTTQDYEGRVGNREHITRDERGTLPTSMLANMPGVRGERPGEHRNKQGAEWDMFKHDIATNGIQQPIFITVDHDDTPRISEGNHRRDAAVELGHDEVPVQIRYFGHAEQQGTVAERAGVRPTAKLAMPWTTGPYESDRCTQSVLMQFDIFDQVPKNGLGVLDTLRSNGWKAEYIDLMQTPGPTVKQFCDAHPTGKFYIVTPGHAMALIDGLLVDSAGRGMDNRRRLIGAYEVYRPDERTASGARTAARTCLPKPGWLAVGAL